MAFLGAIAVLPLLLSALTFATSVGFSEVYPDVDMAMLELYTSHAAHGKQTVGPYSRFGWNHPGPAYFYLLAPLYVFSGQSAASLFLSARLMNCFCAVLILVVLYFVSKKNDSALVFSTIALLPFFFYAFGPSVFTSPWNPYIIVLPFCVFTFCCTSVTLGNPWALPLMGGLGSFLVQTHVSVVPCVSVMMGVSLILFLCGAQRKGRARATIISIVATLGVLVIMWLPPLTDEYLGNLGNLRKLYRFFVSVGTKTFVEDAIFSFSKAFGWFPMAPIKRLLPGFPDFEYELLTVVFSIFQIVLLPIAYISAVRRGYVYRAKLALLIFIAAVTAAYSCTRSPDYFSYLFVWISSLGFASWAVGGAMVIERVKLAWPHAGTASMVAVGLILVLTAVNAWHFVADSATPPQGSEKAKFLSSSLIKYLRQHDNNRVIIYFNWTNWVTESAVVMQVYKAKIPFSVRNTWRHHSKQWPLLIEDNEGIKGGETICIAFGGKTAESPAEDSVIAEFGGTCIYVLKQCDP